jgi:hypothetical protein
VIRECGQCRGYTQACVSLTMPYSPSGAWRDGRTYVLSQGCQARWTYVFPLPDGKHICRGELVPVCGVGFPTIAIAPLVVRLSVSDS